jgi:hypothetical protein
MAKAGCRLGFFRETEGRAHFVGDSGGNFLQARLVAFDDVLKQRGAFFQRPQRKRLEGTACGSDGAVDVGGGTERYFAERGLGGRVDYREPRGGGAGGGVYPSAIDIELVVVRHKRLLIQ